jgi:hypothetical protein
MMQSHQRLSQYKIQNYENKIIQRLQKFLLFLLRQVMGTLRMHPRPKLKNLVKICAGFVNRRKTLFND